MKPLAVAAALTVVVVWGLNFVVAKVGLTQFPPLMLLVVRFSLVVVLLAPFLRPHGKPWAQIVGLSVLLGGLHFGLLFLGLRGVDAGPAAIAIQLAVPFSALLAAVFYRERLGWLQALGMAVAFAGVYVLAGEPRTQPSLPHFLLVVAAAFAWAGANILIKEIGAINVFTLNAWMCLLAVPQLAVISLVVEDGHMAALAAADWRGWGAVAYTAIGASIVAYGLWYWLIRTHDVNRIVPLTLLAPVLAVFAAVALLDEPLTARIAVGGLVTITGVAMIQFLKPSPRGPAES